MTSFDKELTRFLDARGDACDVWAAVRQRAAAGGLLDTPYLPPPCPPPRKSRARLVALAAAAAALVVVVGAALTLAVRQANLPLPPAGPGGLAVSAVYPGGALLRLDLERYDAKENTLVARLINDTSTGYTFGMEYSLSRLTNGSWTSCPPADDWTIIDLAGLLPPHGEFSRQFSLAPFFPDGLEPGDYRLDMTLHPDGSEGGAEQTVSLYFHAAQP